MLKLLNLSEKISKYLIAAVLIIVPLFPKFPLISVPGIYVAIRFEDLFLLLLAIILLPKIIIDYKNIFRDKIIITFLIFLGAGLVSLIAGSFLTRTADFQVGIFHWVRRVEYIMPFFAVYLLTPREKISSNINFYIKVLMIVVIVAFAYGLGQMYLRFPVIVTQNENYSKGTALFWTSGAQLNSTFAGHYDLAAFIAIVLPIFITQMVLMKDKISKFFLLVVSGTGLWLLISSISRIAQVAYLLSVGLSLVLVKRFKAAFVILVISLVFIATSAGIIERFQRIFNVYAETSTPVPTPAVVLTPLPILEDRSTSIRLHEEWPRAIRAFEKNPIIGTGYSSIGLATDNDYLRMLGETGILGTAAFGLVVFQIGKLLIKGIKDSFVASIVGALAGTLLIAVFIDIFEASKFAFIFWGLIGCAASVVKSKSYVQ